MNRRIFICGAFSAALTALLLPKKTFADCDEINPEDLVGHRCYGGLDLANTGKKAFADGGVVKSPQEFLVGEHPNYLPMHLEPVDMQFIDSRRFQESEIARIFRVNLQNNWINKERTGFLPPESAGPLMVWLSAINGS